MFRWIFWATTFALADTRKRPQLCGLQQNPVSILLLLAVIFHVRLGCFVGMMPGVKRVAPCGVCMMCRFLMVSTLMMLSGFAVVARGMRMVLR